jgi:hypothetical protein
MSKKSPEELLEESRRRWEEIDREYQRNWKAIAEADEKARKEGKLTGRYIKHGYADGYAVYQIMRENKKTVRIKVCRGIGDDWVLPAWGEECTISKQTALSFIDYEDGLREMFAGTG